MTDIGIYQRGFNDGFNRGVDVAVRICQAYSSVFSTEGHDLSGLITLLETQRVGYGKKKKIWHQPKT